MAADESIVTADDGVRLWAARHPGGQWPVVFCHGGPGIWDTLEDVAELLRDVGTVHRWDQRGCGRSERCGGPFTMGRAVADLDAVRAHFGLERMVVLGHSWGAKLGMWYALEHPERVSALVYVSGMGIDPEETWRTEYRRNLDAALGEDLPRQRELAELGGPGERSEAEDRELCVLQWSADFAAAADGGRGRERARAAAERMATPFYGVNVAANTAHSAEDRPTLGTGVLRERCAALDVPVLVVDGARDIRPRRAVDSLAAALPRVERVVLPEAGHLPWVEDPEGFGAAVRGFLASSAGVL